MVKRVYIENNYLIIANNIDLNDDKRNSIDNVYIEKNGDLFIFYRKSDDFLIESILFSNILDKNGVAYTSANSFTKIIEIATGSSNTKDYYLEVAKENVDGQFIVNKFGRNEVVGTTLSFISIGAQYQTPLTATNLEIVSASVNDTSAGSGGRKVTIVGLNSSFNEISVEVTLNGTTAVAVGTQFVRVYRMYVSESGSYATISTPSHNGRITLRTVGGGVTWAIIDTIEGATIGTGIGQTQISGYTIPAGYTGYLLSKTITVESNKPASVYFFKRENADDVATPFTGTMRLFEQNDGISTPFSVGLKAPIQKLNEKTDVGFFAKVGTGTASVSTEFQILVIKN